MKVLWVNNVPTFGGPHNIAMRLRRPLEKHGFQSIYALPCELGSAAKNLLESGMDVRRLPLHRMRSSGDPRIHLRYCAGLPLDVRGLRRLIRTVGADLVVITTLTNPQAAVAARLEGAAVVWQIVDTRTPELIRRATMPLVRRWADALMFNGAALARLHMGDRSFDQDVFVFLQVVDTDLFRPSEERRRRLRQRLGIPDDAPLVGTVANLNPQKGLEWFIRAAQSIYRRHPDAHFLLCGARYSSHDRYMARLEKEMRHSAVPTERFILADEPPSALPAYYAALDVKMITSIPQSEGTTTTGLEAMAAGVPVVATDVGAVSEIVADKITGVLVRPLDPDALAFAANYLLEHPERTRQMGAAARERAICLAGLERSASVHVEAFRNAMDRRAHLWRGFVRSG